jgi:DnaJ-class molecular chaperone
MRDLYEALGVARTATQEEIKKAYRRLARRYHPDVNPGKKDAEKRFREVQEAYAVLSDEAKRQQYDRFGTVDEQEIAARHARSRRAEHGRAVDFDLRNLGGFADLGGLFGDLFQGMGGRRRAPAAAPLEATAEIDFADAIRGASVVVPVRREVPCAQCGGTGSEGPRGCPRCHGAGVLVHTDRLRVRLPAGIADGDRVHASTRDGGEREVSVIVRVRPHAYFERKGDDIHTVVPVTFAEAYLGAEVEIGTIYGPVRAKIPPGTQSGQRFRLRGKGVRNVRSTGSGDHYYTVQVAIPRVMSTAGREVARRSAELYPVDPRKDLPRDL